MIIIIIIIIITTHTKYEFTKTFQIWPTINIPQKYFLNDQQQF